MLDLNNQTPLTLSQIAPKAPAVVEQNASPRVSKHYVHIPTTVLISDMKKLGWEPWRRTSLRSTVLYSLG